MQGIKLSRWVKSASISFRVLTVSYASRLASIFFQLSEDFLLVQAILVEVVDDEPCKPCCVEPAWSEFSGYSNDGQATLEIIDVLNTNKSVSCIDSL